VGRGRGETPPSNLVTSLGFAAVARAVGNPRKRHSSIILFILENPLVAMTFQEIVWVSRYVKWTFSSKLMILKMSMMKNDWIFLVRLCVLDVNQDIELLVVWTCAFDVDWTMTCITSYLNYYESMLKVYTNGKLAK
jgi:hypothetical protein